MTLLKDGATFGLTSPDGLSTSTIVLDNSGRFVLPDLHVSGDISLPDGAKLLLGTGADMSFFHNGSDGYIFNETGDTFIRNTVAGGRTYIQADNGAGTGSLTNYFIADSSTGQVTVRFNGGTRITTTSAGAEINGDLGVSGNLSLPDGAELRLGTGDDLVAFHNGSNGYFDNSTGATFIRNNGADGVIKIQSDNVAGTGVVDYFRANGANGQASMSYDGLEKINTTSTGAAVTGDLDVSGGLSVSNPDAIGNFAGDKKLLATFEGELASNQRKLSISTIRNIDEGVSSWNDTAIRLESIVDTNATAQQWMEFRSGTSTGLNAIAFGEGDFTNNQQWAILDNGNFGIGVASPTEKLEVGGNITVTGTVDGVDLASFYSTEAILRSETYNTIDNAAAGRMLLGIAGGASVTGDVLGELLFYNRDASTSGSGRRIGGSVELQAVDAFGGADLVFGVSTSDPITVFDDPSDFTNNTIEVMRLIGDGESLEVSRPSKFTDVATFGVTNAAQTAPVEVLRLAWDDVDSDNAGVGMGTKLTWHASSVNNTDTTAEVASIGSQKVNDADGDLVTDLVFSVHDGTSLNETMKLIHDGTVNFTTLPTLGDDGELAYSDFGQADNFDYDTEFGFDTRFIGHFSSSQSPTNEPFSGDKGAVGWQGFASDTNHGAQFVIKSQSSGTDGIEIAARAYDGSWTAWTDVLTPLSMPTILAKRYVQLSDYVSSTSDSHTGMQAFLTASEGREGVINSPIGSSVTYGFAARTNGSLILPLKARLIQETGALLDFSPWNTTDSAGRSVMYRVGQLGGNMGIIGDLEKGDTIIPLSTTNAALMVDGMWLHIGTEENFTEEDYDSQNVSQGRKGEWVKVAYTDGGNVHLVSPIKDSYTDDTNDNSILVVRRNNGLMADLVLDGIRIRGPGQMSGATDGDRGIRIGNAEKLVMRDCDLTGVIEGLIDNTTVTLLDRDNNTQTSYGIAVANTTYKFDVVNSSAHGGREAMCLTVTGDSFGAEGTSRGVNFINNLATGARRSGFATHDNHDEVLFHGNRVDSCEQGFDCRIRNATFSNNIIKNTGCYNGGLDCGFQLGSGVGNVRFINNYMENVLRGHWMPGGDPAEGFTPIEHEVAPGDMVLCLISGVPQKRATLRVMRSWGL